MTNPQNIADNLQRLTDTVESFCLWLESLPARELRPQPWGPREVLAHLVFWHEYYSTQSVAALAGKATPIPAARFAEINTRAVNKFQALSPQVLAGRFRAANRRLCRLALANEPRTIIFRLKADSQAWKLSDLIPAAAGHIRNHLAKLTRVHRSGRSQHSNRRRSS
jgi:hypothetical protein